MHPFEDLSVSTGSVGIHWFGQSSFAFKHPENTIVQVDPYFPRDRRPERFLHARPPLHEASLRTDYVLLTHNHRDHTCCESLERIVAAYPEVQIVGPAESVDAVTRAGIRTRSMTVLTGGEHALLGSIQVYAVWAKPPQGIAEDGIPIPDVEHLGYVLNIGGIVCYISGDSAHTFANHEALLAPIRALRPQIGFLTTHPTEGEFPFFEGSAKTAQALGLRTAAPSHYACFVKRTYDPEEWASYLVGVEPLIIPYNQSVVYR